MKEDLWLTRLRFLREIYAVGLQILSDAESPHPPQVSDRWALLKEMGDEFGKLDPALHHDPLPEDKDLRMAIEAQACANAALFQSLQKHCMTLQKQVETLLPRLHSWSLHHASAMNSSPLHSNINAEI